MAIEKGDHEARPLSYQFGKSKTKQTEMVSLTFQFVGGPNDGKRIVYNGYFTDNTAKRTMDSLEHCGWDGVNLADMKGFGSKNVMLVIDEEANQEGELFPVVKWVNRLFGRGPATVYEKAEVQSLAERMAALNAERRKENAERSGKPAEPDPFGNG
jgi:hypothetical protein